MISHSLVCLSACFQWRQQGRRSGDQSCKTGQVDILFSKWLLNIIPRPAMYVAWQMIIQQEARKFGFVWT